MGIMQHTEGQSDESFRVALRNAFHDNGFRGANLLAYVIQLIAADPRVWNQAIWASATTDGTWCGTTGCIAGHAALATGYATFPPRKVTELLTTNDAMDHEKIEDTILSYSSATVYNEDGASHSVRSVATERLGLTGDEAEWLFNGVREMKDILRFLTYLRGVESLTIVPIDVDDIASNMRSRILDEIGWNYDDKFSFDACLGFVMDTLEQAQTGYPQGSDIDRVTQDQADYVTTVCENHMPSFEWHTADSDSLVFTDSEVYSIVRGEWGNRYVMWHDDDNALIESYGVLEMYRRVPVSL